MSLFWLYDLPTWLFAAVIIAVAIAFGVVGLQLTREWVRRIHRIDHSHNDIVGYFFASLTVLYGITLGLVAVGTWETFTAVNNRVDVEAQLVASLYRDSSAYPPPVKAALQQDLADYVNNVIDVSWPMQARGLIPYQSGVILGHFQDHLIAFQPTTPSAEIVQAEVFRQLNALIEARRARLDSIHSGLPAPIWALVILGGALCVMVTWFFHTASYQMHVWMTLMMSALLGLLMFMIAILDHPFRGGVNVSIEPFELIRTQLLHPPKRGQTTWTTTS